jgi:hypothetical protein
LPYKIQRRPFRAVARRVDVRLFAGRLDGKLVSSRVPPFRFVRAVSELEVDAGRALEIDIVDATATRSPS